MVRLFIWYLHRPHGLRVSQDDVSRARDHRSRLHDQLTQAWPNFMTRSAQQHYRELPREADMRQRPWGPTRSKRTRSAAGTLASRRRPRTVWGLFDGIRVQSSTITTRACDAFVFNRIEIVRGAASGLFGGALDQTINYGHKAPPSGDGPTSICRRAQIARASAHKTGYKAGSSSGRAIREYCVQTCHAVPVPDRRLRASHRSRVDQTYSSIR
jgi:hypothetical protein